MGLQSKLFKGDQKLEACLIHDSHVTQGAVGDHVSKIQTALFALGSLSIDARELSASLYGKSTAGAFGCGWFGVLYDHLCRVAELKSQPLCFRALTKTPMGCL